MLIIGALVATALVGSGVAGGVLAARKIKKLREYQTKKADEKEGNLRNGYPSTNLGTDPYASFHTR